MNSSPAGETHLTNPKYVYKEVALPFLKKSSLKDRKQVHIHDSHSNRYMSIPADTKYREERKRYILTVLVRWAITIYQDLRLGYIRPENNRILC
jgi:hypothetical protein